MTEKIYAETGMTEMPKDIHKCHVLECSPVIDGTGCTPAQGGCPLRSGILAQVDGDALIVDGVRYEAVRTAKKHPTKVEGYDYDMYFCSECLEYFEDGFSDYCPHCGAKFEKEQK